MNTIGNGARQPAVVVFSSLFPSEAQPLAGLFIRERMFRVAELLPLSVVSPSPWFPGQGLLRTFRPHFRPRHPSHERQNGVDIWHPRFFSTPGLLKSADGSLMAAGAFTRMRALVREGRLNVIDAHFGYPDGYAAVRLGRRLGVPVSITLRGTEIRHAHDPLLRPLLRNALTGAAGIVCVSSSLRDVALELGAAPHRIEVIGNGVDAKRFVPCDRQEARRKLGIPSDSVVLVSVGGLVERKGFHRVIEQLPLMLDRGGRKLLFLIVGGASPEGNMIAELESQVKLLGLTEVVRFLGARPPDELGGILSAADVFVLATRNEGWANVLLEAMACGLPVVTTDVGGNREVVRDAALGTVVPFGDGDALRTAIEQALHTDWDRAAIRRYAEQNSWDNRIGTLVEYLQGIHERHVHRHALGIQPR